MTATAQQLPTFEDEIVQQSQIRDDTPIEASKLNEHPAPEFGAEVDALLKTAASSSRVRTQVLGRKALNALADVKAAIKREEQIAAAEAELSRLRKGGN